MLIVVMFRRWNTQDQYKDSEPVANEEMIQAVFYPQRKHQSKSKANISVISQID